MAVSKCNSSLSVLPIVYAGRFNMRMPDSTYRNILQGYLYSLKCPGLYPEGCTPEYGETCEGDTIVNECNLTVDGIQFQTYGGTSSELARVDFFVDESNFTEAELPIVSYSWDYDENIFNLYEGGTTSYLLQVQWKELKIPRQWITEVKITVVDSKGCTYTKICDYKKVVGVGQIPSIDCENLYLTCISPDIVIDNVTSSSFNVTWPNNGLIYDLRVEDTDTQEVVYQDSAVVPPRAVIGLEGNHSYTVYLNTHCPDGTITPTIIEQSTNIPTIIELTVLSPNSISIQAGCSQSGIVKVAAAFISGDVPITVYVSGPTPPITGSSEVINPPGAPISVIADIPYSYDGSLPVGAYTLQVLGIATGLEEPINISIPFNIIPFDPMNPGC